MKCAIYARYSSELQNEASIESQVQEIRQFLQKKGWEEVAVYQDKAVSGTGTSDRGQFHRMVEVAKSPACPFEAIVVWDRSRFSRNPDDIAIYERSLNAHGVVVLSTREEENVKLTKRLKDIFNELFIDTLREHTKRGQRHNVEKWGFCTGGTAPFGYRTERIPDPLGGRDKSGNPKMKSRLAIDETYAPIVRRIFELYANGNGLKAIAHMFNDEGIYSPKSKGWDCSTVRHILHNEKYIGRQTYGKCTKIKKEDGKRTSRLCSRDSWVTKDNAHEAIISADLWDRVRKRHAEVTRVNVSPRGRRGAYSKYLLSGIMVCSECGSSFVAGGGTPQYTYYRCGWNNRRGSKVCSNNSRINSVKIEEIVVNTLLNGILTAENVEYLVLKVNELLLTSQKDVIEKQEMLTGALKKVEKEIENLIRFVQEGGAGFASVGEAMKNSESHKTALLEEMSQVNKLIDQERITVDRTKIEPYLSNLRETLLAGPMMQVRDEIKKHVGKIVVYPKNQGGGVKLSHAPYSIASTLTSVGIQAPGKYFKPTASSVLDYSS